ncbi:hypothetical protein D3C85_1647620 [compost metagenome]
MVNSTMPSTTGNHAPCSSLAPLAITKPRSMMKKITHSGMIQYREVGHSARATSASSRVSMSMVADTEMP